MASSDTRTQTQSFAFTQIPHLHEQLESRRFGVENHLDSHQLILQAAIIENSV